jgi:hypothetical protein
MNELYYVKEAWAVYRRHNGFTQRPARVVVSMAVRSDGYAFFLIPRTDSHKDFVVFAGCRHAYSLAQYRKHAKTYGRGFAWKKHETLAILDLFASVAKRVK